MIKHIVIFRLLDEPDRKKRLLVAESLSEIFCPLKELPSVFQYNTGVNFCEASHAWDFVIDSVFESREKLKEYQDSPEHTEAVAKASKYRKEKAVIDYEIIQQP